MEPLTMMFAAKTAFDVLGSMFGHKNSTAVPRDLRGLRGNTINMLNTFLQNPDAAMTHFFGQQSDLQRQTRTGISEFLRQPAPETRAWDFSRPILEGMMTGTGRQFERDISTANSQGGRFGSANAVLRGEALRNLFNQRNQTAQTMGVLAQSAGNNPFDRMMRAGAFADQDQDRRAQLLSALFGMGAQGTLSLPMVQSPNAFAAAGQGMGDMGQLMLMLQLLSNKGGGGQPTSGGFFPFSPGNNV